jgi:hypothetical protein
MSWSVKADLAGLILSQESLNKALVGVSRTRSNKDVANAIWRQFELCDRYF